MFTGYSTDCKISPFSLEFERATGVFEPYAGGNIQIDTNDILMFHTAADVKPGFLFIRAQDIGGSVLRKKFEVKACGTEKVDPSSSKQFPLEFDYGWNSGTNNEQVISNIDSWMTTSIHYCPISKWSLLQLNQKPFEQATKEWSVLLDQEFQLIRISTKINLHLHLLLQGITNARRQNSVEFKVNVCGGEVIST